MASGYDEARYLCMFLSFNMFQLSSLGTDSFQPVAVFSICWTLHFPCWPWFGCQKRATYFPNKLGLGVSSSSLKEIKEFDRICYHTLPIPPNSHLSPAYGRRSKSGPCRKRPGTLRCFSGKGRWRSGMYRQSSGTRLGTRWIHKLSIRQLGVSGYTTLSKVACCDAVIAKDQIELSLPDILAKGPTWVFQRSTCWFLTLHLYQCSEWWTILTPNMRQNACDCQIMQMLHESHVKKTQSKECSYIPDRM